MSNNPPNLPDNKLDSHLTVFKDSEKVVDRTVCGRCHLMHTPPLTHELHEIIVADQKKTLECDDCIYGNPGPHKEFVTALTQLLLEARIDELEHIIGLDASHIPSGYGARAVPINARIAELKALKDG